MPRRTRWIALTYVLTALAAMAITISFPDNEVSGTATPVSMCSDEITVYFGSDEKMREAAGVLRGDPRIRSLVTETRQQAWERFKEIFKDQPSMIELGRPEALPWRVTVIPAPRVPILELATQLRQQFPAAENVIEPFIPC